MSRILALDFNACRLPQREPYRLLAKRGHTVRLLVPHVWKEAFGEAAAATEPAGSPLQVQRCPLWFNGRYHRVLFRGLGAVVRDFKPDQMWVHAEPENWLAWQAARARDRHAPWARLSLVSWRNIDYPRDGLPYRLAHAHQRLEDRSRDDADQVLCYNADAERILGRLGFAVAPTRMGVNLGYFTPGPRRQARRNLGLPEGSHIAGFAGRFIDAKGGSDLIEAAKRLPGLQLLFVGGGPAQGAWKAQAQAANVTLHIRQLEHGRMADGLRAMDVLVLPSRSTPGWLEQFGRVLIEAMACGIPVIGSDSGAIPEVIGDAGLVFPEGKVERLADCLRRALAGRAALAKKGRARARRFEWKAIAPQLDLQLRSRPLVPLAAIHGIPIFAGTREAALREAARLLSARKGGAILYANAHMANLAADLPRLRRCLRHADLVLPDGGGIVLAGRWAGQRVAGQMPLGDLLGPLAALAGRGGAYFWGGEPGEAEAAARNLGLELAGASHGHQQHEREIKAAIAAVRRSRARLLFVGQGSPRQELLIERLRQELPQVLCVACGNAMTFAAGRQRRAPDWMRRHALEWLWRLLLEPRRLFGRYVFGNIRFLLRSLRGGI